MGALRFLAGFVLSSSDRDFGGISGVWMAEAGDALLLASDGGTFWRAGLRHDSDGRLEALEGWRKIAPGRRPGDPRHLGDQNAESLSPDRGGGLVVAYEGTHRLRRLPLDDLTATPAVVPVPEALGDLGNRGIEALATLESGSLLALAEGGYDADGLLPGWILKEDGNAALRYAPSHGFVPTGAVRLDGTVYLVERRFSFLGGFRARVSAFPAAEARPGARIEARELATLRPPLNTDNFEAIEARAGPDGRVLLYLLSDDNFNVLQRTLLFQFAFDPSDSGPGESVGRAHERPEGQQ